MLECLQILFYTLKEATYHKDEYATLVDPLLSKHCSQQQ